MIRFASMRPSLYFWISISFSYSELLLVTHAPEGYFKAVLYALVSSALAVSTMLRLKDAGLQCYWALPCWLKSFTGTLSFGGLSALGIRYCLSLTAVFSALLMLFLLFPRTGAYCAEITRCNMKPEGREFR